MENDEGNVKCDNGEWGERIEFISLPVTKSIRRLPAYQIHFREEEEENDEDNQRIRNLCNVMSFTDSHSFNNLRRNYYSLTWTI